MPVEHHLRLNVSLSDVQIHPMLHNISQVDLINSEIDNTGIVSYFPTPNNCLYNIAIIFINSVN